MKYLLCNATRLFCYRRLAIAEEKLLSSTTFRDVRILESPSEIQSAEKSIALQRLQEKLAVTHEQLIQSDYNLQRFKAISISTEGTQAFRLSRRIQ